MEEQANLPLPEEQLKQFLQQGDGSATMAVGNKRMQILMLSSATVLSIVNGMRHGMHVKEPTKFSPPTRPFFHAPLAGIGGQLKFDVEERIHYEIVTEEQFDLFDQWYNASQNGENTECEEGSTEPSNIPQTQGRSKTNKIIGYKFLLTGKLNGAHAVLIYISLILKFSCKKNITVFFTIKSLVQTCR